MCIYTVKSKNYKKNIKFLRGGGCATLPNVQKLDVSAVKDIAKTTKD